MNFPFIENVFGTDFSEHAGALAQSQTGDLLQLVHVPTARHPHNTFAYNIELNRIVGYLPRPIAKKLRYVFGKGFCLDGRIEETFCKNREWNCRISIYDTAEMMKPYLDELPCLYESKNN